MIREGLVQFGHCTCMAGLGELCSHVGAIHSSCYQTEQHCMHRWSLCLDWAQYGRHKDSRVCTREPDSFHTTAVASLCMDHPHWGGCGSEGRAGCPPIGRSMVRSPAAPGHMSMCPWARHFTPSCSRRHSHRCVNEYLDYPDGQSWHLSSLCHQCVWMGECWHVV